MVRPGAHPPGRVLTPHLLSIPREAEERVTRGRPCYVFNPRLRRDLNDTACEHCRFYLTYQCPHLDEFLEDVDDLSPD